MVAFVIFILLCGGLYWLHLYLKKEDKRKKEYREYAQFFSDREVGLLRTNKNDSKDPDEIIGKFFNEHPDKLKKKKKLYKEKEEKGHYNRESWKKSYIMDRIFAYDYEDMLFQIYSKVAEEDSRGKWVARIPLKTEDLISEISRIRNVDRSEAGRIINLLHERGIISDIGGGYLLSSLLQDLGVGEMWPWNIVSDVDMNLDKWMVAHGYEHKKN